MPKPRQPQPPAPSPESSVLTKDTDPAAVTLAFAVIDQVVSVIADYVDHPDAFPGLAFPVMGLLPVCPQPGTTP
jgi:hypothetical protein